MEDRWKPTCEPNEGICLNEEKGGVVEGWLRRILTGHSGRRAGLVLMLGLVFYVQLIWDHPTSRAVLQMAVPTDA